MRVDLEPHGIEFHHFHGNSHPKVQGSISENQFIELLSFIGTENIISAEDYLKGARVGQPKGICLTFDDTLKCQVDVAFPILRKYGLTVFWFIYTAPLLGVSSKLEIYRYFRCTQFETMDSFYESFFEKCRVLDYGAIIDSALSTFDASHYLMQFPFYTDSDRTFRFIRNDVLGEEMYSRIMDAMIEDEHFTVADLHDKLWMNSEDVRRLHDAGHVIGLHSHTHPIELGQMTFQEQLGEYVMNQRVLTGMLGEAPITVGHPTNSYNADTLKILSALGVRLGFRSGMNHLPHQSPLEHPREDKTDIMRKMQG